MALKKKNQSLKIGSIKIEGIKFTSAPDEGKRSEEELTELPGSKSKEKDGSEEKIHDLNTPETTSGTEKEKPKSKKTEKKARTLTVSIVAVLTLLIAGTIIKSISGKDIIPPEIIIIEPKLNRGERRVAEDQFIIIEGKAKDKAGISRISINGQDVLFQNNGNFKHTASLSEGRNVFTIQALDKRKNLASEVIVIEKGNIYDSTQPASIKPILWVLSIGVSNYNNPKINLEFADYDAICIANILKKMKADVFQEVRIKILTNQNATREKIIDSMDKFLRRASLNDVAFIFIAGHGIKHKQTGSYYFLPYEADLNSLLSKGLKWTDFEEAVKIISMNAKKVILAVDTCHAGAMKVFLTGLEPADNLSFALRYTTGIYTLSASKFGEESIEDVRFKLPGEKKGHGAFTYAILKGMNGEADTDNNKVITLGELFTYVSRLVPQVTNGRQHPYFRTEGTDLPSDLHIALAK